MGRSAILTGKLDARDRAKQRHRQDRRPAGDDDAYQILEDWISSSEYGVEDLNLRRSVDVAGYLQRTDSIELPPEERLRQLAIHLEGLSSDADFGRVDEVYAAALRLAPTSFVCWHSRGITAKHFATVCDSQQRVSRLSQLASRYLHTALDLAPRDPRVLYSLGKFHYTLGNGALDAREWFEQVLAIEPGNGWARLYRGHCLQDAEDWAAAAQAYDEVPLETFKGPHDWRVDLIREQNAYCLLRAGQRAEAFRRFERLLARLEKEPSRTLNAPLPHLPEACRRHFRDELWPRYHVLATAEGLPT